MVKLEVVDYGKQNGKLIAVEVYSDGSTRTVYMKDGIVDYILKGSEDEVPEDIKKIMREKRNKKIEQEMKMAEYEDQEYEDTEDLEGD